MINRLFIAHLTSFVLISCKSAPPRPIKNLPTLSDDDFSQETPENDESGEDNSSQNQESEETESSKGEKPETNEEGSGRTPGNGQEGDQGSTEPPPKSEVEALKESSAKAIAGFENFLGGSMDLVDLASKDFASLALTKEDAEKVRLKLFEAVKKKEAAERLKEIQSESVSASTTKMRYLVKVFGVRPAKGHSLFISLHGGGQVPTSANDEQWRNQINLYQPSEGIYIAPRAPTDTWDLWQLPHIDALLTKLIANYILTAQVDPNRIYLMGYSAGGDGLYQLGPRLADRVAAAAMMAGHPGDASPLSLRNIGFSIHCGGDDSAFDRNKLAGEWLKKLDQLEKENPGFYKHSGRVVAGKGHWMDLEDKEAVPWMAKFTRNPFPKKISWHQDDVTHNRFYWVRNDKVKAHTELNAELNGQAVTINDNMEGKILILLNDAMLDLDKPLILERNGKKKEGVKIKRTIKTIAQTFGERYDPEAVFTAEIEAP